MTEEEKNELADAFRSYDWIISYTNPIAEKLYLHNTAAPPYIEKRVNEYKEGECTRYYIENRIKPPYILSSMFINRLLLEIVREGIPLYKVGNKEISCVADIKRLWNAAGVTRTILEYKELYQIAAYLEPQRLKIEKKLMLKLKPEKQSLPAIKPETGKQKILSVQSVSSAYSWSINIGKSEVLSNGKRIATLTGIPFKIFKCLYKNKGKFVKNEILEKCWDSKPDYEHFLVDTMNGLETELKNGLKTFEGINVQGKIIESKKTDKRKITAYKLPI